MQTTHTDINKGRQSTPRGFASMSPDKVQEAARKGGEASAAAAGHKGMSERGKLGGEARKQILGSKGYAEMGQKGGKVSAERAGHAGMSEQGKEGGKTLKKSAEPAEKL